MWKTKENKENIDIDKDMFDELRNNAIIDALRSGHVEQDKTIEYDIYDKSAYPNDKLHFSLSEDEGFITLEVVDNDGERMFCSSIVSINTKTGKLIMHHDIDSKLGLQLNEHDRIQYEED